MSESIWIDLENSHGHVDIKKYKPVSRIKISHLPPSCRFAVSFGDTCRFESYYDVTTVTKAINDSEIEDGLLITPYCVCNFTGWVVKITIYH
jgi:hypothetical protein